MIRKIEKNEISACVEVICKSFMTVAKEFGFTKDVFIDKSDIGVV